ncbi:hypothetical protein C3747_269g38 [Trypanosoma cruzi]|uniref:Uncharacterized protein n=1 Tax=Trypanosoma cruzi TaxID=5693 RepID=A0A2V2VI11_TRYCR|nr:hypothetical protein ECC02_003716 [Trypanosoma cruzi]KAF8301780.1 hypothetical protein TcYC6_0053960 [Trypanosoma cruzi]PWU95286.1 hypothetical protein C3747_269g38 [Trypanosoma cruzi]
MHGSKSTVEMGFCSVHRRKRTRVDLIPLDGQTGQMRCKFHKECRQRAEIEMVICSLHNRRRNMNQMKEVRKGIFECLPQFACRGQFNEASLPTTHANVSHPPHVLPPKGSRPQQVFGEAHPALSASVTWTPTFNRPRNAGVVISSDWAQADRKTWCAKHGKLTSQCEFIKDCYHVCYDASACLSTPLELPSELLVKGCKELLCSKHNALRLVDFLEKTPDEKGYQCAVGHRCRGTLATRRETVPEQAMHPAREAVSSFFV